MLPTHTDPALIEWLASAPPESIDELPYGVIGMSPDGNVVIYNRTEALFARLTPERVKGNHFFRAIAPCTNNDLISHRFETEAEIDALIDYVFTLRMKMTPVRLRLLKRSDIALMYLIVVRT